MNAPIEDIEKHFCYTSSDAVAKICKPLFTQFDISFFQYVKHYYDGGRVLLSSNREWVKDYFRYEHYLHEYVNFGKDFKEHTSGYNLWSGCEQDHKSCQIWRHSKKVYGLDHFLAIYSNYDTYCEMFHFAGKETTTHLPSVFFTNIDLFERFGIYFLDKAKGILKKAHESRFYPPKVTEIDNTNRWVFGVQHEKKKQFINEIPLNSFQLKGHLEDQQLSFRQMQCIKGIVEGKSYKQIAQELELSHRTIDYHLSEIRKIFRVKSKKQLLDALYENDVIKFMKHID